MAKRRGVGPSVSFFAFQDIITAVVGIFILIILILVLELAQRVEAASTSQTENVAPIAEAIAVLEDEVERLREEMRERSETVAQSAELNVFNRDEKMNQLRAKNTAAASRLKQIESQLERIQAQQTSAETDRDRLLSEAAGLDSQRQLIERFTGSREQIVDRMNRLNGNESEIYRDRTEEGRFIALITVSSGHIEVRDALTRSVESMRGRDRLDRMRDWLDTTGLQRRQLFFLIEPGGAADFAALKEALAGSGAVYGFSVVESNHSVRLGFELERLP